MTKTKQRQIRAPARRSRAAHGYDAALSEAQKKLRTKHGTPAEFARACYDAVPGFISMDEAGAAVRKYSDEWNAAA